MAVNNDGDIIRQNNLTVEEFNNYFCNKMLGNPYNKSIYIKSSTRDFDYDKLECDAIFGYYNKVNSSDSYVEIISMDDNFNAKLCNIILENAKNNSYYYTHWFNHFVPFNELAFNYFVSANNTNLDTVIHSYYYYIYSNPNNSTYYPMHYKYDDVVIMLDIIRNHCILNNTFDLFKHMFVSFEPSREGYREYIPNDVYHYHTLIKDDFYYNLSDDYKLGIIL